MASRILTHSSQSPSHKSSNSLGAGSPFTTNSSIPRSRSPEDSRRGLKRRSTNPHSTTATPAPSGRASPTNPHSSSSSPAPLRRSLSFKLPIRVSTESAQFPSSSQNRARAQSLPQQPESQSPSSRRHSKRFSLVSISELTPANIPLEEPPATSPTFSAVSLGEQFLLDRGLISSEPVDNSKSAEELQSSLQEQVVKYLTNMSSPNQKASPELERAPASYPSMYQSGNMNGSKALTGPGLPMPGLSGPPNGPIGNLLKGAVGEDGKLKDAGLMVGIKLDLEAEVHLTARVRGDILVGLY